MKKIKIIIFVFLVVNFSNGFTNTNQNYENTNHAGEWNGWRGSEKEGVLEKSKIPLQWDSIQNMKWNTKVIGKGYSSPIVSGESILLTTAYESSQWKTINKNIKFFTYLFLLIAFLIFINYFINFRLRIFKDKKFLIFVFVGYLILIGFIFFGRSILNYSNSMDVRSWLATCYQLVLCAFLILALTYKKKQRIFIGLVFILFSSFCVIGAPPSHSKSILNISILINSPLKGIAYWLSPVILFVIGILQILNVQLKTSFNIIKVQKKYFAYYIIPFVLIILLLYISFRLLTSSLFEKYINGMINFQPYYSWLFIIIFFSLIIVLVFIKIILKKKQSNSVVLFGIHRIILVFLGIMIFSNYYYVSSETTFIRSIVSINKNDGSTNWICEGAKAELSTMSTYNSPATPTPVCYDERVYAYFGSAGLVCSNMKGELLWLNQELKYENIYGVAISPIICDGLIIIVADLTTNPYITAIDCKTGKKTWVKKRPDTHHYNGFNRTPLCKTYLHKNVLFVYGLNSLIAYEVKSGDIVKQWKIPNETGDPVLAPISDKELNLYFASTKQVFCFNPNTGNIVWNTEVKNGPNCSTPVLCNGLLFMISERGYILCLDTESGEQLYRKKLKGNYFSSPVATNNTIIFCSYQGLVTTIEANNNFNKLSECNLNEKILASPAITNQQLLLRTESKLYCIQKDSIIPVPNNVYKK